jgi:hypothetical protein
MWQSDIHQGSSLPASAVWICRFTIVSHIIILLHHWM